MPARERLRRSRWLTPLFAVAIGVVYLVAGLLGDDMGFALGGWP